MSRFGVWASYLKAISSKLYGISSPSVASAEIIRNCWKGQVDSQKYSASIFYAYIIRNLPGLTRLSAVIII